ncbi:unnamed protein product, partial [Didymodactylos carnosus]
MEYTTVSCVTKKTSYEVMFGQPPSSDSEFWKLVDQNNIDDEDDLPTPVSDMDVCQYGKLQNVFSVENLVDLKSACPQELKQLNVHELKDISFIEACKLH